jgi:hypothetical protein
VSHYDGLSDGRLGLDRVARRIVWDPKLIELRTGSLPTLRAWLFGEIRRALEDAARMRERCEGEVE